ncbi:DnaA regulatory inactivator Hda [Marinicellulosiphila megalodicopiae]|uniref:DnaA regulatory inactivator Hda n=1 Tax=Marinicellulosiphila megalodicopiae TaxID=2724896 RepID=UPI003BB08BC6
MSKQLSLVDQIPLGVQIEEHSTLDTFHIGSNEQTYCSLRPFLMDEKQLMLCLWGQTLSGVTHLLQAVTHLGIQSGKHCIYLPLKTVKDHSSEMLNALDQFDVVCLDDLEDVLDQRDWQESLFNLINRFRASKKKLVVGMKQHPAQLEIELKDLRSRLNWGLSLQIHALNEQDLKQALQEKAHRQGLLLSDELANYIVSRAPRDIRSVLNIFEKLDHASLVEQKKLTVMFAKKVMNW